MSDVIVSPIVGANIIVSGTLSGATGATGTTGATGPKGDTGLGIIAAYVQLASNPDILIVGTITRDTNNAAISAPVVWPDGVTGVYTADTPSAAFPGAIDAYHITYLGTTTKTYTQPAVTRNVDGAVTIRPGITVT